MSSSAPATNTTGHRLGTAPPSSNADHSEADSPLPFFPAGLELLYDSEKEKIRSLQHAFFLATHSALIRGGLRRTTTTLNLPGSYEIQGSLSTFTPAPNVPAVAGTEITGTTPNAHATFSAASASQHGVPSPAQVLAAITERPEPGWAERIDGVQSTPVVFTYMNPLALEEGYYKLEFYALNDKDMIVRITNSFCPAARNHHLAKTPDTNQGQTDNKSSQASSFVMPDFVQFGPQYGTAIEVFYKASLLERTVFKNLFERMGLPINGLVPNSIGIYDDTPAQVAQRESENRARDYRNNYGYNDDRNRGPYRPRQPMPNPGGGFGGPIYAPPIPGGGGLGRSDLDPLGGVGAGMLADPRGFRRTGPPAYPGLGGGGIPPGARFDPFGPVGPGRGPLPGPPGRNPGQFAGPNPDHEQPPPGFEDMFM